MPRDIVDPEESQKAGAMLNRAGDDILWMSRNIKILQSVLDRNDEKIRRVYRDLDVIIVLAFIIGAILVLLILALGGKYFNGY